MRLSLKRVLLIPQAIHASIYWGRARYAGSHGHYEKALSLLAKMNMTGLRNPLVIDIFKAQLLGNAGKHKECLFLCQELLDDLTDPNRDYSKADMLYYNAYISWIYRGSKARIECDVVECEKVSPEIEMYGIDLSEVSKELKSTFPLEIHPLWEASN